jgi:hypothetical protein
MTNIKRKRIIQFSVIAILLFVLAFFWCDLWGAHNLGHKFVLLEGDKTEDRIIVYSTVTWGCCYTGIPVIPPSVYNDYTSYVDLAISNRKWIIVRSVNNDADFSYWIINKRFKLDLEKCKNKNCDSIIQENVYGPFKFESFIKIADSLHVNLNLTKIK